MKTINQVLFQHPLTALDERSWSVCKRIFNDGRLDRGGRLYGDWQNEKPHERLQFRIDGESVAEIDIKGSHLFFCHTLTGGKKPLPDDPYEAVRFVSDAPSLRPLAKRLVSAILCKEGEVTRFPMSSPQSQYQ